MRLLASLLVFVAASAVGMEKMPFTEGDAVREISSGHCGQGVIGTGLVDGMGWLVQPIPGPVKVCMAASGTIETIAMQTQHLAVQRCVTIDMDAGRPYYVMAHSRELHEKLIWKVPGYLEGPVPLGFQLPPVP